MNELQIFNYQNNQVRTIQKDGEPWFVLKDVCGVLDMSNSRMVADRLDQDEVSQTYITDSLGRQQETTIINESGLYNVILRSDKPQAKPFRKWVTSQVLPAIRKHGLYASDDLLNNPDLAIKAFTSLKEEREKRKALQAENEVMKPKAIFADAVAVSDTTILIGDLAKLLKGNGIETGQKRLFEWLRENGYLIKQRGTSWNMPTQKAMDMKLFEVKESTVNNPDGSVKINRTTKVTGKGQQYFINLFLGKAV